MPNGRSYYTVAEMNQATELTQPYEDFMLLSHNEFDRYYFIQYHIQCIHKRMVRFQKLIQILFLTLHRHNIHRQRRQLSKFLMR
jgi:hypothetical protein